MSSADSALLVQASGLTPSDQRPPAASVASAGAAAPAGLVTTSTSRFARPVLTFEGAFRPDPEACRLRRMAIAVRTTARALHDQPTVGGCRLRWVMLTLTYRRASDVAPRDIDALLQRVRAWYLRARRDCDPDRLAYCWVAELQERGCPHYHIAIRVPARLMVPMPDKRGWWPHGCSNVTRMRHPGYLAKYLSKAVAGGTARYPRGLRIHGRGGLPQLVARIVRYWLMPGWVRTECPGEAASDLRRVSGGVVDRVSGLYLPARYQALWIGGCLVVLPVVVPSC